MGGESVTAANVQAWREALGGRRFLMCMGAHFINTALFVWGPLSEQGYLTTFAGTVAAYLAVAGWQKHVEAKTRASE
jgi:hypothetical protein